jgi:hypothetical protein
MVGDLKVGLGPGLEVVDVIEKDGEGWVVREKRGRWGYWRVEMIGGGRY